MSAVLDVLGRSKAPSDLKLGVEIERFGFDSEDRVIRYDTHIRKLFQEMVDERSWHISYESNGNILGIEKNGHQWSLEPGSQLELSASPCKSITQLHDQQVALETELSSMKSASGWRWEWLALNPYESAEQIRIIPSPRYQIMTDYFSKRGGRGLDMMRLTSGCHANLDYWCPDHAIKLLRVGAFLSPIFIAWFANSPFYKNQNAGVFSERSRIWESVDPLRSGVPDFLFSKSAQIKDYVNLVESTPMMFYYDERGEVHPASGKSYRDLSPTLQSHNLMPAIRQLFLDVRLKPCCVELRFIDQNEPEIRQASFAVLVGLLQDEQNLERLNLEALNISADDLRKQMRIANEKGFSSADLYERAKDYLKLAESGLQRRDLGEEKFLAPAEKLIRLGKNPAQLLLEGGDFGRYQKNTHPRRSA